MPDIIDRTVDFINFFNENNTQSLQIRWRGNGHFEWNELIYPVDLILEEKFLFWKWMRRVCFHNVGSFWHNELRISKKAWNKYSLDIIRVVKDFEDLTNQDIDIILKSGNGEYLER